MSDVLAKLNYQFTNRQLLEQAITHKSFHFENLDHSKPHNEKLEFLGDAVLDLVLSEMLMARFPKENEGSLSKRRAGLVNETFLVQIATDLEIEKDLKLGKGEEQTGGRGKPRLLASAAEAIIGAIFLDGGYEKAAPVVKTWFEPYLQLSEDIEFHDQDYKTKLQEMVQAKLKITPVYKVKEESGPAHKPTFQVSVFIDGKEVSGGTGGSKKIAEQMAAKEALNHFKGSSK